MRSPLHFCKMSHDKRKVCVNRLEQFHDYITISVVFQKEKLREPLKLFPSDTDIIEQDKYSWINDLLRKLSKS